VGWRCTHGTRRRTARHAQGARRQGLELAWHGGADKGDAIIERGGWDAFAKAHAWYDPAEDAEHDPPQEKQAYKLPHHEVVDGRVRVVWAGVRSAMQVLAGARGGVDLPEGDREGVYRHLREHYEEFDREPPPFGEIDS